MSGDPSRRPRCLEIEAARHAIKVEQFPGKIKMRRDPAFHRLEIDLAETHSAAGDKLLFVEGFSVHFQFCVSEDLGQGLSVCARESRPARPEIDAGCERGLFATTRGEGRKRRVSQETM